MEQRDYILREIEKIRTVLQAILGRIKEENTHLGYWLNEDFEEANKHLVEDTRVDLKALLNTEAHQLHSVFKKEYGYDESNIEVFADMLVEMAKKARGEMKFQLYYKALDSYEYVDGLSNSFSFGRKKKMENLKRIIYGD